MPRLVQATRSRSYTDATGVRRYIRKGDIAELGSDVANQFPDLFGPVGVTFAAQVVAAGRQQGKPKASEHTGTSKPQA